MEDEDDDDSSFVEDVDGDTDDSFVEGVYEEDVNVDDDVDETSWGDRLTRDQHLPSTPCSLTNPNSPGPGDEDGDDPALHSAPCTLANPLRNSPSWG